MTVTRRRFAAGALAAGALAAASRSANAVIILDSTWRAEGGFRAHLALADQPQFAPVIALSSDDGQVWGSGSGTWIGNRQGRAHILTAAHVFDRDGAADDYVYRAPNGEVMQAPTSSSIRSTPGATPSAPATTSRSCGSTGR